MVVLLDGWYGTGSGSLGPPGRRHPVRLLRPQLPERLGQDLLGLGPDRLAPPGPAARHEPACLLHGDIGGQGALVPLDLALLSRVGLLPGLAVRLLPLPPVLLGAQALLLLGVPIDHRVGGGALLPRACDGRVVAIPLRLEGVGLLAGELRLVGVAVFGL